ncbi:putative PEP-binding protein [Breznakiellaceae bacterium SP9]
MHKSIHFFSQGEPIPKGIDPVLLGLRGLEANELAELDLPVLPGFILDAAIASRLEAVAIQSDIQAALTQCAAIIGTRYGDQNAPLLLSLVPSPNTMPSGYPLLRGVGLVRTTLEGFAARAGAYVAARELLGLVKGMFQIQARIDEPGTGGPASVDTPAPQRIVNNVEHKRTLTFIRELDNTIKAPAEEPLEYLVRYAEYLPAGFFDSAEEQLRTALRSLSRLFSIDVHNSRDTAILVQPLVYGSSGEDSCSGTYFTRNVQTGEAQIQGSVYKTAASGAAASLDTIEQRHREVLTRIARTLEDTFHSIRAVRFAVEAGSVWLIEQEPASQTAAQAAIKLLLDLAQRHILSDAAVITAITPKRLATLLHPALDLSSAAELPCWSGGIAGSPGSSTGRVYLSTAALLHAHKAAIAQGQQPALILVLPASFAEDVKAIELASAVLTAEGGYSAHASVVARQYGKVSLVAPELKIEGAQASLGELRFAEGDSLTINVPYYGDSQVYRGAAKLIESDFKGSGLFEVITICKRFIKNVQVRANADTPRDAALAFRFGADGIGLCRTEHLFLSAGRINVFREMLLANTVQERTAALSQLERMQTEDFQSLFRSLDGKPLTIRLLDAPLYEFMPHTSTETAALIAHLEGVWGSTVSQADITRRINALREFNPMLGQRGCRIAVCHPEIYAMQVRAIFAAAYRVRDEGLDVRPEILVPLVMNAQELRLIAYGKKIAGTVYAGIADIEEAYREERGLAALDYTIGAMIELPAAALGSGDIAKYAGFFSFGTNDLTQTTLGQGRDDCSSFLPDYQRYGLLDGNPFSSLDASVKELIALAVSRGRLTRPDLVCGLCGEQGAHPAALRFALTARLDYVSCSPYSVPLALLALAQAELETETRDGLGTGGKGSVRGVR